MTASVHKSEQGRVLVEGYYVSLLEIFPSQPRSAGSMSNSASWLGILDDFADSFSLYCVDIPDEPGLSEPLRMPHVEINVLEDTGHVIVDRFPAVKASLSKPCQ